MSISETQAYSAVRALLEGNVPTGVTALRWQDQDADSNGVVPLPDVAATFLYSEFTIEKSGVIEIGRGRGANRHRVPAQLVIFVLSPRGNGLVNAGVGCLEIATTLAAFFRSTAALGAIKVDSATAYAGGDGAALKPKGLDSAVAAYFWAACEVEFYFDLIG